MALHVLTGFLGSGKTELLRALLTRTAAGRGARIGVLVNEVGELPVDQQLLEEVDEGVMALPGGCVCCVLRDDLYGAVVRLAAQQPDRIVLETTGLADPAPILAALTTDRRLRRLLRCDGVVTVVDCLRAESLFEEHAEFRRQLDFADRIVLTKVDLAGERGDALLSWLAERAPGREVRRADRGDVDAEWLFGPRRFHRTGDDVAWLHHGAEHHHRDFSTHLVESHRPVDLDALQLWLRLVTQVDGERLLRIKALVRCANTGGLFVVQSAGRSVSAAQRVESASDVRGAEVVVIQRGMPEHALAALLVALRSALLA